MITVTVPVKNQKRPAPIEVSDFNSAISKMAAFVSKVGGEGGPLKLGDVVLRVNGKAAGVGSEMNSLLRRNFKELSSTEVVVIAVRLSIQNGSVLRAVVEGGVGGGAGAGGGGAVS